MGDDIDLFVLYRWLLATVCAVYTAVRTWQSLWRWLGYFGSSRHRAVMGHYAGVLLLRIRLRRLTWELCQIGVLLAALVYVIYLHRTLDSGT